MIEYKTPHELEGLVFEPNLVKWNTEVPTDTRKVYPIVDKTLPKDLLRSGDLEREWASHRVVEIRGANMDCEPTLRQNPRYAGTLEMIGLPKTCPIVDYGMQYSQSQHRANTLNLWQALLWRTLFRPSPRMLATAEATLKSLSSVDFSLGIHIRVGGHVGGVADAQRLGQGGRLGRLDWKRWFADCAANRTKEYRQQHASAATSSVGWFVTSDQSISSLKWLWEAGTRLDVEVVTLPKKRVVQSDRSHGQ